MAMCADSRLYRIYQTKLIKLLESCPKGGYHLYLNYFSRVKKRCSCEVFQCIFRNKHAGCYQEWNEECCGDIYRRPYTFCRRRQFMPVLPANIVTLKYILSFSPALTVVPKCATYIAAPHCKTFKKIIGKKIY